MELPCPTVKRALLLCLLSALAVAGSGSVAGATAKLHPAVTAPAACGATANRTPHIRHVIVVLMENHSYSDVIGKAPFVTALARRCERRTTSRLDPTMPTAPNSGWSRPATARPMPTVL